MSFSDVFSDVLSDVQSQVRSNIKVTLNHILQSGEVVFFISDVAACNVVDQCMLQVDALMHVSRRSCFS